jgi:hypothetical protein
MTRTFTQQVYDTNGTTPQKNIINHMNERAIAQNNLAKSGGAPVAVPQFRQSGPVLSPQNTNSQIAEMAQAQLKMDSLQKAQANTGMPQKGGKRKTKRKPKRKNKRKSRKYYLR